MLIWRLSLGVPLDKSWYQGNARATYSADQPGPKKVITETNETSAIVLNRTLQPWPNDS